ncbi:ABC transporter ATP-binding protein [Frankia sp. QA3]|uniref:ABC transporter ATP-binding protein n=1 Tax=Frankia sp. QA3 TaxID=710111 RepID=UPI000269BB69|nr:ABC transporter ATP-binding protein [Frankia sp. QA3]EIV92624.1 oligopeptide/dipeptide ABC transporter, ATP-binding protein [Frankia sp. QA3]
MAGTGTAHLRTDALLRAEHLVVEFPAAGGRKVHAVSDVSVDLRPGETVGLVGESGCGKSTTARVIAQHLRPTSGTVHLAGRDLAGLDRDELRRARPRLQMVFQDPISSLNPGHRVEDIVGAGLRIWRQGDARQRAARVAEAMEAVGLRYDPRARRRRTHLSGGQCQRLSIARALVLRPQVLVCDEPVSSLDVSVQAQILNLLVELRTQYHLSMIFISHDLAVVGHISDRVVVMYLGRLCEVAPPDVLYRRARHPYTRALVAAVPGLDARDGVPPDRADPRPWQQPSPLAPPSGCRFRTRCPRASRRCAEQLPQLREIEPAHFVACHHPVEPEGVTQPVAVAVDTPR